jgi:nucleoside-diphosphate-sugar epimerase
MRILVTGNMGYVGPVLVRRLRRRFPLSQLIGFDAGYFAHCLVDMSSRPETLLDAQYFGDIREFPEELLAGVDAVVHLAALSNDPVGQAFEYTAEEINFRATSRLAALAANAGIKSFVFASSCAVYGAAGSEARTELDEVAPLTAYARSKIAVERALASQRQGTMTTTCLRFATACGMSPRLRLDLVLNEFVASAVATGEIAVRSDGTPWRPLIDVSDMARAIEWAIVRPSNIGGRFLVINTGSNASNYSIREVAEAVATAVPGSRVKINRQATADKRSYKVDFSLFASLAPNHLPVVDRDMSIGRLKAGLEKVDLARSSDFSSTPLVRLGVLKRHIEAGRLSPSLRWPAARFLSVSPMSSPAQNPPSYA